MSVKRNHIIREITLTEKTNKNQRGHNGVGLNAGIGRSTRTCVPGSPRQVGPDARIPKQEGFHVCAIMRNALVQMQPRNSFIPLT